MSGNSESWDDREALMEQERFLEHTHEALRARFSSLSDDVLSELIGMPALFAYEKGTSRAARVGSISSISRRLGSLKFRFSFSPDYDPIEPEMMQKLRQSLDITEREMNRSHWAIKEVDLLDLLTRAGLRARPAEQPAIEFAFARLTIVKAAAFLKTLTHAEFDEFLLELGVEALDAGRTKGSRQARATALAEYVVSNGDARTAEGMPLAEAIVRRAVLIDLQYPDGVLFDVDARTREQFWRSLQADGYGVAEGVIVVRGQAAAEANQPTATAEPEKIESKAMREATNIFIVHGRDDAAKTDIARFIERLGLTATILHEQPNGGRTLMAKFMEIASKATFAIVLMTPDDVGGMAHDQLKPRARQNVIFELGFFVASLGAGSVCALVAGEVERPSDFEGVVYVKYGPDGGWRAELARELRAAKISFDANKVF